MHQLKGVNSFVSGIFLDFLNFPFIVGFEVFIWVFWVVLIRCLFLFWWFLSKLLLRLVILGANFGFSIFNCFIKSLSILIKTTLETLLDFQTGVLAHFPGQMNDRLGDGNAPLSIQMTSNVVRQVPSIKPMLALEF